MKAKAIVTTSLVVSLLGTCAPLYARMGDQSSCQDKNQQSQSSAYWSTQGAGAVVGADLSGQSSGQNGEFAPAPVPPPPVDRATHLIGMKVKNPHDKTLGTITDVVFDLQSGRVSYVVLKKAGRKHGTGEFAAIPPSAFTTSSDMKHLVLNADKVRVQNSQGFSRNNYPPVGQPAYGAQPREQQEIIVMPIVPDATKDQDQNLDRRNQNLRQNRDFDQDHTLDQDQSPSQKNSTPIPE